MLFKDVFSFAIQSVTAPFTHCCAPVRQRPVGLGKGWDRWGLEESRKFQRRTWIGAACEGTSVIWKGTKEWLYFAFYDESVQIVASNTIFFVWGDFWAAILLIIFLRMVLFIADDEKKTSFYHNIYVQVTLCRQEF